MSFLIKSATVIDSQSAYHGKQVDILIEHNTISAIGKSIKTTAQKKITGKNLFVSPGWVDVFADYCDPGFEQKETISSGLKAAAAGGFTDVLLVPNTIPLISNKAMVEYVQQKSQGNRVSLHVMGAVSKQTEGKELAEMMDMQAQGAIAFTDGWHPLQNAGLMLKALEYVKAFDGILVQLPVHQALASGGLMHEGAMSVQLGMSGIPAIAEPMIIHRDLELLRYTQSRLHISGVSSAEGLKLIRQAKKEGLQITCSVTPYHLLYTDKNLSAYESVFKTEPALRTETDRKALVKGLEDGTIDCIASHHRPQDWDAKEKEFEYAQPGMISQETCWNMLLMAAPQISMERWVQLLSEHPRKLFKLPESHIQKAQPANITIFDTDTKWIYTTGNKQSLAVNSPLFNHEMTGKIFQLN